MTIDEERESADYWRKSADTWRNFYWEASDKIDRLQQENEVLRRSLTSIVDTLRKSGIDLEELLTP